VAAPVTECPTCAARGEEITRALAYAHRVEHENRQLLDLRDEVEGLRRLRPAIAELELEIAVLRANREGPIQDRNTTEGAA
jgi:hypothetical protein